MLRPLSPFCAGAFCACFVHAQIEFVDVTAASGIAFTPAREVSVAVGDFDGDGWLDVCFTGAAGRDVRLFRNLGDGTFADVTDSVLPPDTPQADMALFADWDNDGRMDLLLGARYGPDDGGFALLRNVGGAFVRVPLDASLARHASRINGIAVGDLNRNGLLDAILTHKPGPGFCLLNDGANGATDATAWFDARLANVHVYWATVIADFNSDGLPDVHSTVDFGADHHAIGMPDGTFHYATIEAGVPGNYSDMGIAIGDINNNGHLDFFNTNIGMHVLYVNDGTGAFTNQARQRGVEFNGQYGVGWGTVFSDFDLDGDMDLVYVAAGVLRGSLYVNNGAGFFTEAPFGGGLNLSGWVVVEFDFDNDGDMDVLIIDSWYNPYLYKNVTPAAQQRNWLTVSLEGVRSNRFGIGARVEARTESGSQYRQIISSDSFRATRPPLAHFGLGQAQRVDRVRIEWPDGGVQLLADVAVNQRLHVRQTACPGDLDGDGGVELTDLSRMLTAFNACADDPAYDVALDLDGDDCVGLADVFALLAVFGTTCD